MTDMKTSFRRANERGAISGLQIAVIGLSVLVLALGSFGIWAFVAYSDATSDVEGKIAIAVAEAREKKGEEEEARRIELENQPNLKFTAPADYCSLSFLYPKIWSAYESEQLANGGDYLAYFHPKTVPPISNSQQFALRVVIEQKDYDDVVANYDGLVQKGDLKQSTASSEGKSGMRLTGNFSKNIRGDAVIYECRDKTITIRTDADVFQAAFDALIRTIDFNQ